MDKMRWRYGDTNPVVAAVRADTKIEIGDLLYLDGSHAKPVDDGTSITSRQLKEVPRRGHAA